MTGNGEQSYFGEKTFLHVNKLRELQFFAFLVPEQSTINRANKQPISNVESCIIFLLLE